MPSRPPPSSGSGAGTTTAARARYGSSGGADPVCAEFRGPRGEGGVARGQQVDAVARPEERGDARVEPDGRDHGPVGRPGGELSSGDEAVLEERPLRQGDGRAAPDDVVGPGRCPGGQEGGRDVVHPHVGCRERGAGRHGAGRHDGGSRRRGWGPQRTDDDRRGEPAAQRGDHEPGPPPQAVQQPPSGGGAAGVG
ncbi:hypothetical protein IU11_11790 [Cellulosimicrobium sp. MM]|nr:hypothetical protein IU11_11790 [Cellulosimicrobium sp. MM]